MRAYFADILIKEVEDFVPLAGKKVLDVGGASGIFCKVLSEKRNCTAYNLDPAPVKYSPCKDEVIWPDTKIGFAEKIPFECNEFDLVICRAVLEHIPHLKQQASIEEIYRVTKKGGLAYIAIPPWYCPFAGHAVRPFHYLPFKYAKALAKLLYNKNITANSWQEIELFPISFRKMLRFISKSKFKILATKDTHFRMHFLTKIPLIREITVPSAAFILKKD